MTQAARISAPTALEKKQTRRLRLVLGLVTVFCAAELVGAAFSRSAVLRADALHLLLDVFALAVNLGAMRLAQRAPTRKYTFGFRRAEALAAVLNGVFVIGVSLEILRDGYESMGGTETPDGNLMLIVAVAALVVTGFSAWLLHGVIGHPGHNHAHASHHHHHDHCQHDQGHTLNLRGAMLHLIGDALGAIAAVIAAIVIRFDGPAVIDPIASVFVAIILLVGVVRLLRDAVRVLFEGAPQGIDPEEVRALLSGLPGVATVGDVRVWTLGGGHDAIAAQLVPETTQPALAESANRELKRAFSVHYAVVQVDPPRTDG